MSRLQCFTISFFIQLFFSASAFYRAGVVDYTAKNNFNLIYKNIIHEAKTQSLDLLVFPSLNSNHIGAQPLEPFALSSVEGSNLLPCSLEQIPEPLRVLSCAAKEASMYIVTNVEERYTCDQKHQSYSTNLVFDRKGFIVSINRKPLFASTCNTTLSDLTHFDTDFDVTFAHLHDEDVVLTNPELLLKSGIKNYVLPSRMSYTAFMEGIQYYSAWVYTTKSNLLVSGTKDVVGDSGSAVFSGRNGAKVDVIQINDAVRLIIGELMKNPEIETQQRSSYNNNYLATKSTQNLDLRGFNTKRLDIRSSNIGYSDTLCDDKLCCNFFIKTSNNDYYAEELQYRLAVYNGLKEVAYNNVGLQICSLLVCAEDDHMKCQFGLKKNARKVTFEKILVSGNFSEGNSVQFPATLTDDISPLTPDQFHFDAVKSTRQVTVYLTEKQTNLVAFGIFGRDFAKDTVDSEKLSKIDNKLTDDDNFLNYLWFRLKVVIFIASIYVLEQI